MLFNNEGTRRSDPQPTVKFETSSLSEAYDISDPFPTLRSGDIWANLGMSGQMP